MSLDPLFRREALEARATHSLGVIRIARPLGDGLAGVLAICIVAAVLSFAVFGTYTKRATVPGLLEPEGGTLRLAAPIGATVLAVRTAEGRRVAAGDVLFVLSGERVSDGGATQAAIAVQLEARKAILVRDLALSAARDESRARTARERLSAIDVELARVADESGIHASRQRIADANVERFASLARTGFVAEAQAQARVDDALLVQAQRASLARIAATLARERTGLTSQVDDSRLQSDGERADIARALALLEQERSENDARRSAIVTAPHDARVTGIAARAGQVVGPGGLLATLIPDLASLEAVLFASTRQAGFVAVGQRVRLRYPAYPYQKFGMGDGVVRSIEQSPYAPAELPPHMAASLGPAATHGAEPVYRIVVRIESQTVDAYGQPHPLRPGMVVDADIVQDRRRLIEWLFEPLYGLVGRSVDVGPVPIDAASPAR